MKKLLLILVAALAISSVSAQQRRYNPEPMKKKVAASDKDIADPKKNVRATTWMSRGDTYYEATVDPVSKLRKGLTQEDLVYNYGEPSEKSKEVINEKNYEKWTFEAFDVFFVEGQTRVSFWNQKIKVLDDGVPTAFEAYKKAVELDPKQEEKVKPLIEKLVAVEKQRADKAFITADYKGAAQAFAQAYELAKDPIVGAVDTISAYNAGYLSVIDENYPMAIKYLNTVKDMGFYNNGDTFKLLHFAYKGVGDNENAEAILKEGIEKFPENTEYIELLMVLYSNIGKDARDLIPMLEEGIKQNPNNYVFQFSRATMYMREQDYENAIEKFKKALEISPNDFASNYNLGVAYARTNDKRIEEMNTLSIAEQARYDELKTVVNETYQTAIPYLLKAHEVNPKDLATVELLRNFYFRSRDDSPEAMAAYEKFDALYKELGGN